MIRALVLGANGRIGRLLRSSLAGVAPVWQARRGADLNFDILTQPAALKRAISQVDVVLNLAGATHHGQGDLAALNVELARHVLDGANGKPVFLMSSAAVYGVQAGALAEDTPLKPVNAYAEQKVAMERMVQTHPNPSVILRLGNVVGADALLGMGQTEFTLHRFADGTTPARSYIGPRLLGHVLGTLMSRDGLPPVINIATPKPVEMADLLRAAGHDWATTPAPETAIRVVSLDTTRLQDLVVMPDGASRAEALVKDWQSVKDAP